jgi:hypothetical protein
MIPMVRLHALLPPPIRRLLTVQCTVYKYSMIPMVRLCSSTSSNQKAADCTVYKYSLIPMVRLCSSTSSNQKAADCTVYKYSMIPMFRLLAPLPPPIRRLLTGKVLYDPYVQAPGSPASSNQKAADRTSTL